MSTPELVAQIREALAKIPHEAWCGDHGYSLTRHSCDCLYDMRCSCDREERIAEAVARAIEAASYGSIGKATRERVVEALAALEEVRP